MAGRTRSSRVDPRDHRVQLWKLPERFANANLNTGVFDHRRCTFWFTGQNGVYRPLQAGQPSGWTCGRPRAAAAPTASPSTPGGGVWYVSLAGNHLAQIDTEGTTDEALRVRIVEPPTPNQGARRVWTDSHGRLWISEWNSGNVSMHDPRDGSWKAWRLPGERPRAYSVYVDPSDKVWLTDFPANAVVRFDPATETFLSFPSDKCGRQCPPDGRRRRVKPGAARAAPTASSGSSTGFDAPVALSPPAGRGSGKGVRWRRSCDPWS
jgi:virginiamycin B lyase